MILDQIRLRGIFASCAGLTLCPAKNILLFATVANCFQVTLYFQDHVFGKIQLPRIRHSVRPSVRPRPRPSQK